MMFAGPSSRRPSRYYICHHCLAYRTRLKNDIKRHFKRVRKCENLYMTPVSYAESEHLSAERVFLFYDGLDPSHMSYDLIRAITISCESPVNHITKDGIQRMKDALFSHQSSLGIFQSGAPGVPEEEEEEEEEESSMAETKMVISSHENASDSLAEEEYKCGKCNTTFSTKYSLLRHITRSSICEKNRQYHENRVLIQEVQKKRHGSMTPPKGNGDEDLAGATIPFGGVVIQNYNQSNIQNIHHNNNSVKVDLKDFVNDIYDHTHIDYRDLSTDFYVLKNFLALIMENKTNQNILFMDNARQGALVYTRDDIRKMPCDKAGFILLEKLYKTMDDMIVHVVKNESDRGKFTYMSRYYKMILEKYRCDTTYREYNVDTHTFYNTPHSKQFRSRDEYLAEMMGVIRKYTLSIEEGLLGGHSGDPMEMNRYMDINPNIEDFASTRVRYRDLKV